MNVLPKMMSSVLGLIILVAIIPLLLAQFNGLMFVIDGYCTNAAITGTGAAASIPANRLQLGNGQSFASLLQTEGAGVTAVTIPSSGVAACGKSGVAEGSTAPTINGDAEIAFTWVPGPIAHYPLVGVMVTIIGLWPVFLVVGGLAAVVPIGLNFWSRSSGGGGKTKNVFTARA